MQNWDDLRLFLAVARHQSLTAAGRDLRLDPATMGRRVARLEEDLGAQLFHKSPRGYTLTDAGQRLLERAETAETVMRAALADAQGQEQEALSGQVRIGAPDGCANYVLPQVCTRIAELHPELELQIVALPRVFNLTRREADIAIGVSPPASGRLLVKRITDYKLHLAASDDYLALHGPIKDRSDLTQHRIVGYIPDMIFDRELDYLADIDIQSVALASNSVAVQLNLLRAGAGVGIVHDFALHTAPTVRRILIEDVSLKRAFYIIRHEADRDNARLSRLSQLLSDGIRQEVTTLEAAT
jgi:DNA-binding transcriptional LysR family regulator